LYLIKVVKGFIPLLRVENQSPARTQESCFDSAFLDACWGYIVLLALGRQQPFQQCRVHDASEPYLAVDRHDWNLVAVLRRQLGIGVDIHLGDLETVAPLKVLEQIECLVATTALHASVDGERQMLGACSGSENACE